jgi:anti-anti-sigma factor
VTSGETRVTRRSVGEIDVIELDGEVDFVSADEVRKALCAAGARTVVVELGAVDFIDSAGLRALDAANRDLRADGRTLALVAPPASRAAFTFRIAGFPEDRIHDSVEAVMQTAAGG